MDTALQFQPAAVAVPGVDPKLWAASRQKYAAADVPIIGITLPYAGGSAQPSGEFVTDGASAPPGSV